MSKVVPVGDATPDDPPSAWLLAHAAAISAGGRVLDLACGRGRQARWLAEHGRRVLAVDRDAAALRLLADLPGIEIRCCDLEGPAWPFGDERFAAVVVSRYLFRPRLGLLVDLLAEGGVLVYETFMDGNERFGRPANPDFLLRPGELRAFAEAHGLHVLDFAEGFTASPRPAMMQALCARRPADGE